MTKDDILLIYEYDRWANSRTFAAAAKLSHEQFTRDLGGSFRSVRDTLVHILGGEWIWLTYWSSSPENSADLMDIRTRRDALFLPETMATFAAVEAKWREVEQQQLDFLDRLTGNELTKLLPFRSTSIPLVHLMQHMANHSTYHRGQIALMMRQLGAEPLATDFHLFCTETHT
ncbi:MAG: DinB family protein [Acidobacteria bacterium]|nr:DinB family protein [Acidobacteriota bacterium]